MIETTVRKKVQPIFNFIGRYICIPCRLSPNSITLLAFITGLLASGCVCANKLTMALVLLCISGICDVLDGTVARLTQRSFKIGAYIDLISDRMVESAMIIGFTFLYPQHYLAYITFLIAVLLHFSTFVAAGALFQNTGPKSMHHDASFVERAEAFIIFALMLLFPQYIFELLMTFNCIVLIDGAARFVRVLDYANVFGKRKEI